MAQIVEQLTLDFGSGYDFMGREFKSHVRLHADSAEPSWDSRSIPLSLCPFPARARSLSQNK